MSEKLARLTAKGIQLNAVGGGLTELTSAEVSAALSGLPDFLQRFAYACFIHAGDLDSAAKYDIYLVKKYLSDCFRKELKLTQSKADKLAAIHATLCTFGEVCTKCNGSKSYILPSGKRIDCGYCKASGFLRHRKSELSRIAKVHRSNWNKSYEQDYLQTCEIVTSFKESIVNHVNKHLKV